MVIGICDDGKKVCDSLQVMLDQYFFEKESDGEIRIWYSGEDLCEYLKSGNPLDIIFLDIELLNMTGIAVGNYIRNVLEDRSALIIYISYKATYAPLLFKTQPLDFLVKPIYQEDINEVMELAEKILRRKYIDFVFKSGSEYIKVPLGRIKYFASEGRRIRVVTSSREYTFYGKLQKILPQLSADFIVIHKSFIVNWLYVEKYEYDRIRLNDGVEFPISKVNRATVRSEILKKGIKQYA